VCDLETSRMGAPYIYIYDISRLRVNTASGIITLKTSERSKITKITRIHCSCSYGVF